MDSIWTSKENQPFPTLTQMLLSIICTAPALESSSFIQPELLGKHSAQKHKNRQYIKVSHQLNRIKIFGD